MLSKLPSQNFKLCSKQYNEIILLHLIVAPQLGGSSRHNYSTKTRQEGHANDQAMYSLMSISSLALFISIVFALYFLIHSFNNILSLLLCFLYAIFPFSYVSFYYILFLFLSPFSFFHPFSFLLLNLFLLTFSCIFSLVFHFFLAISISAFFLFLPFFPFSYFIFDILKILLFLKNLLFSLSILFNDPRKFVC